MGITYIKKNGITKISDEEIQNANARTLLINRLKIRDFLPAEGVSLKDDSCKTFTSYMLCETEKGRKNELDVLTMLTYRIISAESIDDFMSEDDNSLYTILNNNIMKYIKPSKKLSGFYVYKKAPYTFERDLPVMITIAKDIIKRYIRVYMTRYKSEELDRIDDEIFNGASPLNYISINDNKMIDLEDQSLKEFINTIFKYYLSNRNQKFGGNNHLCIDCGLSILECPKMMDIDKKHISDYDFIEDGIQKTHFVKYKDPKDENAEEEEIEVLDEFLITKCKKYVVPKSNNTKKKYYVVKK